MPPIDPIAFIVALLIFLVVCVVVFAVYKNLIEQAVPANMRPYVLAILGILAILAFLRFVLHLI